MQYEVNINKNLDLGLIFKVSLLSKYGNLCNTHFTIVNGENGRKKKKDPVK